MRGVVSERALFDRHDASGLFVVEHRADHGQVARELKDLDRNLRLTQEVDQRFKCFLWVVWELRGDQPAMRVLEWRDQMTNRPLPLSMSIIDRLKQQKQSRHTAVLDAMVNNEKIRERNHKQAEADAIAVASEFNPRRMACLPRSRSLQMSRNKRRRAGENV